ncbi:oxidoreductase, short chain dehydrogenase/reductase family protein [Dictyocaulus viviparus]|uniref:Oxidoreductase, short chain dehydrogenase/reductase family protein n=1 Tax=Dictyocaulus viviparus TaxID=29172 RepID=A0A0D8XVQ8_DICVI|nr:oxidoreductase, short chain dehydrogenase/reductase family protein [Dictyocaulus viviparus]
MTSSDLNHTHHSVANDPTGEIPMPVLPFKRTILITGSTDGIGKQTAIDLAAHPDNHVIIHGRSVEKCEITRDHIIKETGNATNIDYIAADLSVMKEVAHFADQVKSRFPDLNVLVCNAGVLNPRRSETKDGLEMTFQVNYLSHFILCNRLADILENNDHGRIMVVGSPLHSWTALDWSDVMATKDYEKYLVYSRSKLCLHLMAFALHRRMNIARRNLAVNVIELGKEREPNNNGKMRTTSALSTSTSTLSMFRAAGNLVQLIENPAFQHLSGKYLDSTGKQIRSGSEATDERLQERLWAYSVELSKEFL